MTVGAAQADRDVTGLGLLCTGTPARPAAATHSLALPHRAWPLYWFWKATPTRLRSAQATKLVHRPL
ncbi:hypothetical protein [Micromonospora sp. NPDC023633]|uniref:hypothetical protein n=1 Tax=Micromonospora sp. NPDC023633 TaxID=3154320 RepID=UPI0033FAE4AD